MIDAKLLNRVLNKDAQAFEELYNLKYADAFRLARSKTNNEEDAEEAVQNAMLIVFQKLDTLKNVSSFDSWFNRIVVNCALNVTRKNQKEPINFSDINPDSDIDFEDTLKNDRIDFSPEDFSDKQDLIETVGMIMEELTEDQRFCLQLYYYNDMKIADIAEALEVPENTVKTRLSRGKRKFEAIAKEYEKKGFKLFGMSALPFFFEKSFKNIVVPTMPYSKVIAPVLATSTTAGVAATSATVGTTVGVSTAGATTAATSTATTVGTAAVASKGAAVAGTVIAGSVAKKVVAGVTVAAIVAGGGGTAAKIVSERHEHTTAIVETTTLSSDYSETTEKVVNSQKQSTTNNIEDKYANMSYSSNNMCGTPYTENKDYEFVSYYEENSNGKSHDYYDQNTKNTIQMFSKKAHNLIWSIKNAYALYMILINNYLFYLNEYDHFLYSVNINDNKPTPKKISIGKLVTEEGHPPSSVLTSASLNFYYRNGKILYISKYEDDPYNILACSYDVDKKQNAVVVEKESYSGLYVNSDGIIDTYENILYDELGNQIKKNYTVPKILTVFENDFSKIQENTEDLTYTMINKLENNKKYVSQSSHCPYFDAVNEIEVIINYETFSDDSTNLRIENYPLGED